MKAQAAIIMTQKKLSACGISEAKREAELICAHVLSCHPNQLFLRREDILSFEQQKMLQEIVEKRALFYPLQYLLGCQEFMSLDFLVNPAVLIPRWDTERLVEAAISLFQNKAQALIADICCGSGAIGISLAHYLPRTQVILGDISLQALSVCRQNIRRHGLDDRCHVLHGDLLVPLKEAGIHVDMLISNPPYIKDGELCFLPPDVLYEPRQALAGGVDGLDFYRRLIDQAPAVLVRGGYLLLETASDQKEAVQDLLITGGFICRHSINDYGGNHRGIVAVLT
ncbi:MAG: peptide chain release factor N(5)-glutamine methyltransferase [Bacillota bacterium]